MTAKEMQSTIDQSLSGRRAKRSKPARNGDLEAGMIRAEGSDSKSRTKFNTPAGLQEKSAGFDEDIFSRYESRGQMGAERDGSRMKRVARSAESHDVRRIREDLIHGCFGVPYRLMIVMDGACRRSFRRRGRR